MRGRRGRHIRKRKPRAKRVGARFLGRRRRLYAPHVAPQRERDLVAEILEIVIEAPALDLREGVVGCMRVAADQTPWKVGGEENPMA
jgi:hypothetical protein